MGELVLDISDVRKTYRGKIEALRGISLAVPRGTVFGLLGPNGAGKSTLVKILTSIIRASHCKGTMLGAPVGHKPTLRKVGYLPEHARFPTYLTGRQVIEYSAGLSGLSANAVRSRCDALLETVGMADTQGRRVKTYSKGMKQRIGVAQALINDPQLLFLDEPTDGVDPEGRRELLDLISRLRGEGCSIFINTHLLSELERVADRIAILTKGTVVRVGALDELTSAKPETRIVTTAAIEGALASSLVAMGAAIEGGEIVLEGGVDKVQECIDLLRKAKIEIEAITPKRLSLEELFLETVQESRVPPTLP
jgi:ABC-2 type transport system ATP-binding protein